MFSTPRIAIRSFAFLAIATLVVESAACTQPVDKTAAKAARRARGAAGRGKAVVGQNLSAGGRSGRANQLADSYANAAGYIVKGSDFLTFWPCLAEGYYFLRADGPTNARIAQEYKFASPRPYAPLYTELRVGYVSDSLSVGSRHFSRYAHAIGFTQRSRDGAMCPPPTRETLSNEMQRLDNFRREIK